MLNIHFNRAQCREMSKMFFDISKLEFVGLFIGPLATGTFDMALFLFGLILFLLTVFSAIILLTNETDERGRV